MARHRVEHAIRPNAHSHARGRNGYFVPILLTVDKRTAADGTVVMRIAAHSQRPAQSEPPLWFEMPVNEWLRYVQRVVTFIRDGSPGPERSGPPE